MILKEAELKLKEYGQEHVLRFYETLSDVEKEKLLRQIEHADLTVLKQIHERTNHDTTRKIEPLGVLQLNEIEKRQEEFEKIGLRTIREGKVGAVLLAGGMGTRLGSDDPKGMYNIGLTKEVFIFQRLIENLMDVTKKANCWIPLFIMTSDKNHEATIKFFAEKNYFGYDPEYITFFMQEMAVACDYNGKLFMENKAAISMSPNGNGGWYLSMVKSGVKKKCDQYGVEWLNIFSVDNVLQRIADPVFVGATVEKGFDVGSKVVKKANPDEKVGVMCLEDKKPSIVEYYELTDEMKDAKDSKGEPAYNYGVILNYLFKVSTLDAISEKNLPLHIVEKKINHMNENGEEIKPDQPNGYKFETLVLDMIHMSDTCLPFEVIRNREFAPIKNSTGVDSVETARELCKINNIEL